MIKTTLTFGVITLIILAGGVFLLTPRNNNNQNQITDNESFPENYEYFWSQTCPHCANVAEFMDTWKGKDRFKMEKIEVNESKENTVLFLERGTKICNISANRLGVPLLVTPEGKCFSGDTPIIDYLKSS